MKTIKLYKYIEETSRSWEHIQSMEQLQPSRHMLKHALEKHAVEGELDLGKVRFGVRIVRFTRSAFEIQIIESVIIQEERSLKSGRKQQKRKKWRKRDKMS